MGNFNRGGSKFGGRDSDRGGFRGGRDSGRGGFGGNRGGGYGGRNEEREMFQATCTECGKSCEVPFKPTGSKPVLCRDCFRNARSDDRGGRRDFPPRGDRNDYHQNRDNNIGGKSAEHFDQQFNLLNDKLDKILQRLTPSYMREQAETSAATVTSDDVVELVEPKKVVSAKGGSASGGKKKKAKTS